MAGLALLATNPSTQQTMILLGLRARNLDHGDTWTIPGGSVEEGEDLADGAEREFREETGFTTSEFPIDPATLRPASSVPNSAGDYFVTVVGDAPSLVVPPHTGDHTWETQSFAWFPLDELAEMPDLHPQMYAALPGIRSMASKKHIFESDDNGQAWLFGFHYTPVDFKRLRVIYHDEGAIQVVDGEAEETTVIQRNMDLSRLRFCNKQKGGGYCS